MRVVVYTNDRYIWAIKPFAYLFNVFWSELQPVTVIGFNPPPFPLPHNFQFVSIDTRNYPAKRWTDGLIQFLNRIHDEVFAFFLEDYWLCRGVNHQAIESLADFMRGKPDILRIDLTTDREYSQRGVDVGAWGYVDLIETPPDTPYQMSTQACLVNRENLLKCLRPGMAPWDFELQGNNLIPAGMRVLGTRQVPVRYANGIGTGCKWKYCTGMIPKGHVQRMLDLGILPPNERVKE